MCEPRRWVYHPALRQASIISLGGSFTFPIPPLPTYEILGNAAFPTQREL